jgi:cytochrome b subunit of formate dehydrogenase
MIERTLESLKEERRWILWILVVLLFLLTLALIGMNLNFQPIILYLSFLAISVIGLMILTTASILHYFFTVVVAPVSRTNPLEV